MTSRWSSRVTLTGAASANGATASMRIRVEAISRCFIAWFLPVFRIWLLTELDRAGQGKFPGPVARGTLAGDSQDDPDLGGERGGRYRGLPAAQTRELAGELRVRLAGDRELDDRPLVSVDAPVLDAAEPREQLGEAAQRRVAVAHGQPAGDVGWRKGLRGGRPRRGPRGLERIGARFGRRCGRKPRALLGRSSLALRSRRRRFDLLAGDLGLCPGRRAACFLLFVDVLPFVDIPGGVLETGGALLGFVPSGRWSRRDLLLHVLALPRPVRGRRRRRGLRYGGARRLRHRRLRGFETSRPLELGRGPKDIDDTDGDEHDGCGLDRQLQGPGKEQRPQPAPRPGRRSRRLEHPVDEARRRARRLHRAQ